MNPEKNQLRRIFVILVSLCMFSVLSGSAAAAVELQDGLNIDVPSSIDSGGNFELEINFGEPDDTDTVEVLIEVYVGGILVHEEEKDISFTEEEDFTMTIDSEDFDSPDGKIWEKNLMNYECGDNIEVEVMVSDGVEDESDSDQIDIEPDHKDDELFYELDPEVLNIDDDFTVTVYDQDDDEVKDAIVKFTWIDDDDGDEDDAWDVEDGYAKEETDSKGEVEFRGLEDEIRDAEFGKYQMDIYKEGYCKVTETFDIKNVLNVSDPIPIEPLVGQPFKVMVKTPAGRAATGLLAYMNPGGHRAQVTSDGFATFTAPAPGTYTIAVGGLASTYDETLKVVKVARKDALVPSVTPNPAQVSNEVTIKVRAGGEDIEGATVKVLRLGSPEQILPGTTASNGAIKYTPTLPGDYTIKAEKLGFDSGTDTMEVYNGFTVQMPESDQLKRGDQATIVVKDISGNIVPGANVRIEGSAIPEGITDISGAYKFTMREPGNYQVVITKNGFREHRQSLTAKGALQIKLSMEEISLGESVKITTVNMDGIPTGSNLRITGPASTKNEFGQEYTYTPEKAGDYTVEALLDNYETAKATFKVNPKPLMLSYSFKEGQLIVNATSNGMPAAGLMLMATGGGRTETLTTDAAGIASMSDNGIKNYTLVSQSADHVETRAQATPDSAFGEGMGEYLFPALIGMFALVIVFIFAIVALTLVKRGSGKKKGAMKKAGGSRLDR